MPKPRPSTRGRRCLSPFDCFYERKKLGKDREPYAVALADRCLMAMALGYGRPGAHQQARGFAASRSLRPPPNHLLAELHDRMRVILAPETWSIWFGESSADLRQLKSPLNPYPAEDMAMSTSGSAMSKTKIRR
jgi:putative SOS response-associated peptidase YedK